MAGYKLVNDACIACGLGEYKNTTGNAANCSVCPQETSTASTGATSELDCQYCSQPSISLGAWSGMVRIGESTMFTCNSGFAYDNGTKIMTTGIVQCKFDGTLDYEPSCTCR